MALEVVILFALVTGRILVLPPDAVLYLLHMNKKWGDNKSGVDDYLDFERMKAFNGLEVMSMGEFFSEVAEKGLLAKLPPPKKGKKGGDLFFERFKWGEMWNYLESACWTRQWSPGKIFIGFNITTSPDGHVVLGNVTDKTSERYLRQSMKGDNDDACVQWLKNNSKMCLENSHTLVSTIATTYKHF